MTLRDSIRSPRPSPTWTSAATASPCRLPRRPSALNSPMPVISTQGRTPCAVRPTTPGSAYSALAPVILTSTVNPPGLNTSATVAHDVSTTTITITTRDPNAKIEPNPTNFIPLYDYDPDMPGWQVRLSSYRNPFQWFVRAKNGVRTAGYGLIVYRSNPPASEARLHSLELSGVPLAETFDRDTQTYMATTAAAVTETTVTATPLDPDATAVIKLSGVEDADGDGRLSWVRKQRHHNGGNSRRRKYDPDRHRDT